MTKFNRINSKPVGYMYNNTFSHQKDSNTSVLLVTNGSTTTSTRKHTDNSITSTIGITTTTTASYQSNVTTNTNNRLVINLSSIPLTTPRETLLARGPNFAIVPKYPPKANHSTLSDQGPPLPHMGQSTIPPSNIKGAYTIMLMLAIGKYGPFHLPQDANLPPPISPPLAPVYIIHNCCHLG